MTVVTPIGRRRVLRLGTACAGLVLSGAGAPDKEAEVAALERAQGGRLGVFALDTGSGAILAHRADDIFPMESTFKLPLAALALRRVQSGADTLQTMLPFGRADLLPVSPVTAARVGHGRLPIGTLVAAILERSDNAAANLLLAHVGGPPALTGFLRTIGDRTSTIRRGEVMGAPPESGNTTTPRAFAAMIQSLCLGTVLRPDLRARLLAGMTNNSAGPARLRGGFPARWRAVDRTGTGDGICNDGALAWPPNGSPVIVAVFEQSAGADLFAQQRAMRTIGQIVGDRFG